MLHTDTWHIVRDEEGENAAREINDDAPTTWQIARVLVEEAFLLAICLLGRVAKGVKKCLKV